MCLTLKKQEGASKVSRTILKPVRQISSSAIYAIKINFISPRLKLVVLKNYRERDVNIQKSILKPTFQISLLTFHVVILPCWAISW